MTTEHSARQALEFFNWPAFFEAFMSLESVAFGESAVPLQLKTEVFTVASLAAGCRHCQAHGAYSLHLEGTEPERIRDLWSFESSSEFTEGERAALRLARDAAQTPNAVGPQHFAELRAHFSDQEIVELLAIVGMSGFLNRYSDTLAVVTDQESVDWAEANLGAVGWEVGKHVGTEEEQRPAHPVTLHRMLDDPGQESR